MLGCSCIVERMCLKQGKRLAPDNTELSRCFQDTAGQLLQGFLTSRRDTRKEKDRQATGMAVRRLTVSCPLWLCSLSTETPHESRSNSLAITIFSVYGMKGKKKMKLKKTHFPLNVCFHGLKQNKYILRII